MRPKTLDATKFLQFLREDDPTCRTTGSWLLAKAKQRRLRRSKQKDRACTQHSRCPGEHGCRATIKQGLAPPPSGRGAIAARRNDQRPLQGRGHPSSRTVAVARSRRVCNHPAGRSRATLLRYADAASYGGMTQTKRPPENPGRFRAHRQYPSGDARGADADVAARARARRSKGFSGSFRGPGAHATDGRARINCCCRERPVCNPMSGNVGSAPSPQKRTLS